SPARSSRDPAAILSGAPATPASSPRPSEAFVYFVQVGAYSKPEEAEQQKARLGLQGLAAKVSEREQAGRVVYRVRLGPFDSREQAEAQQDRLPEGGPATQIVRVERP
ncbi:MAG TPA: SPOR domain-containing protein, partial [Rubrivivax sp.]|nr:SPOR domain-containing protein [Rubrivivax sp.]